jgi:pimeloyl-ACP methyl ester carboxylesterase
MALPVISALLPRSRATAPNVSPVVSEPPLPLPPGRVVHVRGRGEFFVRDSGGEDRPSVLLLHGWMFSSDLNWFTTYADLHEAGYRVVALDHRGHGRGLRTTEPFRLQDCADDAAAVLRELGIERALVVGYSMGGAVAQLLARDHREVVRGIVLCATAAHWSDPRMKALWNAMSGVRLLLGLAPAAFWRRMLRALGGTDDATTTWHASELARGSAVDLAEAGRELGRFDARPWNATLDVPAAVVVTRDDTSVPPDRQRELAAGLRSPVFESPGNHGAVTTEAREFNPVLLAALASVAEREPHALPRAA